MIWLTVLLSTACVARPSLAQRASLPFALTGARALSDAPALRATLDNGLRVLCVENQGTSTVAAAAFANTSARAESPALAGIRYFVARALVECSAADQPDLSDRIQDLGADVFSGATLDLSQVTVGAAAEDVGPAVELLRDIVSRGRFTDESLGRLRHQVLMGFATDGQLPDVTAERAAAARLYPDHPLGRPVEGLAATVPSFTADVVRRVYAQSYVPNNLEVVVAGGVPPAESLAAVRQAFAGLLPGPRLPETTEAPGPIQEGLEELHRPGQTGFVHIGGRAPGLADPTYPAATVALAVLGAGMGSRLYAALRLEDPVAYSFSAEGRAARDGARAGVLAACPPERIDDAEGRMLVAVRRMTAELASPEEIRRAKEYIATSYAIAHQRSAELAHQLGALEIAGTDGLALDRDLPRRIGDVTPEQVRDAAAQMFGTRVRIRVLPS